MRKVSDKIRTLLAKQVRERGIVVWYDPDRVYSSLVKRLDLADTALLSYDDGFFPLREKLEPLLEYVTEDGRARDDCGVPPKVVVYVPMSRTQSDHALIETEAAGVVVEPGVSAERNSRLSSIVEQAFAEVAPEKAAHVARQVDEGLLTLAEADQMAEEAGSVGMGTLKLIFELASPVDVLLSFVASDEFDSKIDEKRGLEELIALAHEELGSESGDAKSPAAMRASLRRHLLLGELALALPESLRTGPLAGIVLPAKPVQCDTLHHVCDLWRKRVDLAESYEEAADEVERQTQLNQLDLPSSTLREVQTFPFIDDRLLQDAEAGLIAGKLDEVLSLISIRHDSFWTRKRPELLLRWSLIQVTSGLLRMGQSIRDSLKARKWTLRELVEAYTQHSEPWMLVDRQARHVESRYARYEGGSGTSEEGLDRVLNHCRVDYLNTLQVMAEQYSRAFEDAGCHLSGLPAHSDCFHEFVLPALRNQTKTAYFLVDALRYEMAAELLEGLEKEFEVRLDSAAGQLPGITAVGMAALMPGAETGLALDAEGNRMNVRIQGQTLNDRTARMAWLQKQAKVPAAVFKLGDVVRLTPKRKKEIAGAQLVVITSQEIDRHGEQGSDEAETRVYIDEVLDKLRRACRSLSHAGVKEFVVSADHGFIFVEGLEEGFKMNPPGGQTVELHARVWIGRGGVSSDGYFRVAASDLELGGPLEMAFPRGLGTFKVPGGVAPFFHGGATLQEQIIPICRLTAKHLRAEKADHLTLTLSLPKPTVTNRFFSVIVNLEAEGLFKDAQKRIQLEALSGKDIVGMAAMAAYGFEEGTKEVTVRAGNPNSVTMMITAAAKLQKIQLRAVDCETQLPLAIVNDVPVDLAI
jgi:hypothetical protein